MCSSDLGMGGQLRAEHLFAADEEDANVIVAASQYGAFDFRLGGLVRPHAIDSDVGSHALEGLAPAGGQVARGRTRGELLFFLDRHYFTALVEAALQARAMRQLALVAIGALGGGARGQVVVGAALGGTRL